MGFTATRGCIIYSPLAGQDELAGYVDDVPFIFQLKAFPFGGPSSPGVDHVCPWTMLDPIHHTIFRLYLYFKRDSSMQRSSSDYHSLPNPS